MASSWLFVCVLLVYFAEAEGLLDKVLFLHRHGARMGSGIINGTVRCSSPFCKLTPEGIDQGFQLGVYLSTQYKEALRIPDSYNVSFIRSVSTCIPRAVRTAEAVIMGFFHNSTAVPTLPFVDYMPCDVDLEMSMWTSWPGFVMQNRYALVAAELNDYTRTTIGTANVQMFGQMFGLELLCSSAPTECVNYVNDAVSCNLSAGLPVPQLLLDQRLLLLQVNAHFFGLLIGYNPKVSDFDFNAGSLGFPFAQAALQFLDTPGAQAANENTSTLVRMRHFGAHDWTLTAVYAALGIWTIESEDDIVNVPQFGETLVLEKRVEGGLAYLKAKIAVPGQLPSNHANITEREAVLQCIDAARLRYNSSTSSNGCLLEDVARFVETVGPVSTLGVCYASADTLSQQGCDGNSAPAVQSPCYFYRLRCPSAPCGSVQGAIADPARGFQCESRQLDKGTPYLLATIVALMAPSLLAGAIGGFYAMGMLRRVLWGKGSPLLSPAAK